MILILMELPLYNFSTKKNCKIIPDCSISAQCDTEYFHLPLTLLLEKLFKKKILENTENSLRFLTK